MNNMVNPFLNLVKLEEQKYTELNTKFQDLYVICNKTDENIDKSIYNYYIDKDIFNNIKRKIILYKVPFKILKNINLINKLASIKSDVLDEINVNNYKLNEKNLVLLILNIQIENLKLYLSQYEQNNNLKNIFKIICLNNYFYDTTFIVNQYFEKLLNIEDSNYWANSYNCTANLNKYFSKRIFNLFNKNNNNKVSNYLDEIYKTNEYIDPSKIIASKEYKYKIYNDNTFSKEDINRLFDVLSPKQQFLLFTNLLVSKTYSHLVINNRYILLIMKPTINKYIHLFRYLLGYTWIKFYFEESIKKTYITKEDNFIFDIDTACELPIFPVSMDHPKLNPYIPILVNDVLLNAPSNIGGISYIKNNVEINNHGICNLVEFKNRLNIFATGNPDNDLFENINWIDDKIGIGGGVMAACLQKKHPLVNLFSEIENVTERYIRFFNEYYATSDIDIMILTTNTFDFMSRVERLYNQIVINICKFSSYAEPSHIKLSCIKQGYLFISESDVLELICNNSKERLNFIKKSIETDTTIELFNKIIENEFNKYKEKIYESEEFSQNQSIYPEFYDFADIKFKIRIYTNKENKENTINFKLNYKYKISSPHLNHNLEIFPVSYNDFFATVQTFHLPCVRAYYDGTNVYLTPSCISAHLTYINIDYKYFAGSIDPIEIINKYRMRGFGTLLNANEIKCFEKYTKENIFWNNLYKTYPNNKNLLSNLGSLNFNSKIFQPRLINVDHYHNAPPIDLNIVYTSINTNKIISKNEYFDEINFRNSTSHELIKFIENYQTINTSGSINPLEKWIIECVYNIIENSNKKVVVSYDINKSNIKNYDISGCYTMSKI